MKTFVIIKTGSTLPGVRRQFGDFEDWMIEGCGLSGVPLLVINVMSGKSLPPVDSLSGVIITGSPAMVTEQAGWMLSLAAWILQVLEQKVPLLGICFGHQLLAQAMGGRVDYHPLGREIGTVSITLTEEGKRDPLLGYLPDVFIAHVTHAQTVTQLPAYALPLATNPFERHHAFRLGDNAWGVQFHPEFTMDIMHAYVSEQVDALLNQGYDVAAIQQAIKQTDAANALLKRFYAYCTG